MRLTWYTAKQASKVQADLAGAYHRAESAILRYTLRANLTAWQKARAEEQLDAIRSTLAGLGTYTQEWGQLHLPGLYGAGVHAADAGLGSGGAVSFVALHTEAIELLQGNLSLRLGDALATVGRTTEDLFRKAGLNALQDAYLAGNTRVQATKVLVADLKQQGITAFLDVNKRPWELGRYADMVIRTGSAECERTGLFNRMIERGADLVQVSTSGDPCDLCEPWEGEIISVSGESDQYASVDEAEAAGLFHPNCTHDLMPYSEDYAQDE